MNKNKRSGGSYVDRSNDYYKRTWEETIDKTFMQAIFVPYPALVNKELVNGHSHWQPYYGGGYDKDKFDLIEGMWDHEHYSICNFKITDGNTYWFNKNRVRLLCDECHDYYRKS